MVSEKKYKHTKKELRWGRVAAGVIFFVQGAANGSWLARIPDVQKQFGLNEANLGTILLAGAIGGLIAMQAVPFLIKKFGHRPVLAIIAPLFPLTLLGVAFASSPWILAAALMLMGAWGSVLGVVVNTHAVDVEKAYQRAIMSSFHSMFSIGGLVGAGVGGLMAAAGASVQLSMVAASATLTVMIAVSIRGLLRVTDPDEDVIEASMDHASEKHHKKSWWRGVVLIGVLTFVCFMSEGAVADWSAIFMREDRGASPAIAVAAFVAFSACMTIGRLCGDWLTMKFGQIAMVRGGALLAAGGMLLGIFIPNAWVSIIGFAIVGCGLSILVPILFSVAGSIKGGESHAAIARVSTIAFFGLLFGPTLIGYIAHSSNLSFALLVPATLLCVVGIIAPSIRRVTRHDSTEAAIPVHA